MIIAYGESFYRDPKVVHALSVHLGPVSEVLAMNTSTIPAGDESLVSFDDHFFLISGLFHLYGIVRPADGSEEASSVLFQREKGVRLIAESAKTGYGLAQYVFGKCMLKGFCEMEVGYRAAIAFSWLKLSADQGDVATSNNE